MSCYGSLLDGIAPMFQRQKLVAIERMREPRNVSSDKDIISDNGIPVEGTTHGVTGDPKNPCSEFGITQPFRIADRSQGNHCHLGIDGAAIREMGAAESPMCISLQRSDGHLTAQIHSGLSL